MSPRSRSFRRRGSRRSSSLSSQASFDATAQRSTAHSSTTFPTPPVTYKKGQMVLYHSGDVDSWAPGRIVSSVTSILKVGSRLSKSIRSQLASEATFVVASSPSSLVKVERKRMKPFEVKGLGPNRRLCLQDASGCCKVEARIPQRPETWFNAILVGVKREPQTLLRKEITIPLIRVIEALDTDLDYKESGGGDGIFREEDSSDESRLSKRSSLDFPVTLPGESDLAKQGIDGGRPLQEAKPRKKTEATRKQKKEFPSQNAENQSPPPHLKRITVSGSPTQIYKDENPTPSSGVPFTKKYSLSSLFPSSKQSKVLRLEDAARIAREMDSAPVLAEEVEVLFEADGRRMWLPAQDVCPRSSAGVPFSPAMPLGIELIRVLEEKIEVPREKEAEERRRRKEAILTHLENHPRSRRYPSLSPFTPTLIQADDPCHPPIRGAFVGIDTKDSEGLPGHPCPSRKVRATFETFVRRYVKDCGRLRFSPGPFIGEHFPNSRFWISELRAQDPLYLLCTLPIPAGLICLGYSEGTPQFLRREEKALLGVALYADGKLVRRLGEDREDLEAKSFCLPGCLATYEVQEDFVQAVLTIMPEESDSEVLEDLSLIRGWCQFLEFSRLSLNGSASQKKVQLEFNMVVSDTRLQNFRQVCSARLELHLTRAGLTEALAKWEKIQTVKQFSKEAMFPKRSRGIESVC